MIKKIIFLLFPTVLSATNPLPKDRMSGNFDLGMNFTKNSESTSKKIYKFCNLKWSKDCLNFHKRSDLFINTASNNQIRKNIQKYDDKKYYPYKEILGLYRNRYDWLKNKN